MTSAVAFAYKYLKPEFHEAFYRNMDAWNNGNDASRVNWSMTVLRQQAMPNWFK